VHHPAFVDVTDAARRQDHAGEAEPLGRPAAIATEGRNVTHERERPPKAPNIGR